MKQAGAIIALIAGIFAVIAAGVTLLLGGIGAAAQAESGSTVLALGWGGVLFSFLVIILAAVAMGTNKKLLGLLLIIASIGGAILGGTLVAVFMVLSLIGGILVAIGAGQPKAVAN